ncbi:hypothetical protein HG421_20575 [Xanthomonas campestris pv. badrii]|uniref:Uncharacterized protein n=1 Tax=Xanthomonas campestris pv. badrii TaxID=149696 RepID=A0A7Z2VE78_XANCA|nr:hypothetical protein [Xanthomonas campestris]MCC4603239.1 hypothetical protein [Xanthomonas campestris pv. parthenii]QJD69845.1 hypothetical protein HG421_20575 [Xanthomonas campestris pv. badrii]
MHDGDHVLQWITALANPHAPGKMGSPHPRAARWMPCVEESLADACLPCDSPVPS